MDTSFWLGQTHATLGDHRGAVEFFRRSITPLPRDLRPSRRERFHISRRTPGRGSPVRWPSSGGSMRAWQSERKPSEWPGPSTTSSDSSSRYHHLGMLHLHRGAFAEAVTCFEQALVALDRRGTSTTIVHGAPPELGCRLRPIGSHSGMASRRTGPSLASSPPCLARGGPLPGGPARRSARSSERRRSRDTDSGGARPRGLGAPSAR